MNTKLLTLLLSITFLFFFSGIGYVYGEETEVRRGYWDNGELKSEASFKSGKLDGKATAWYENGKKRNETHFKNGEVDGLLIDWYPSGKKWMELYHKNGVLDGASTVWYKSGAKKSEERYKDGKEHGMVTEWDEDGEAMRMSGIHLDVTEQVQAEQAVQQYIQRLDALRKIDQSISSSFDLKVTLKVLLGHLREQLEIDAACVLLYEKDSLSFSFSQGQGFRTTALQHTNLRLGQGLSGKVALERHPIIIPDLAQAETVFAGSPEFEKENFQAYYGTPLVAKGELVGVLEVFHRSAFGLEKEWEDYLQVMAGQAAIAIDSITLFENLERSNLGLMQAYDATIEGWSRVLEARDIETEGHSRRVVKIAMNLAKRLNINEDDLLHIRRGALLHDIGKMGVPDAILRKPGKLTPKEWEIMRRHPVYAHEWLSKIEYLQPALDIPYLHHEKWEGTGYPHGLKGERIPIAARIFAIVDVWDALRSDRPYRKAWSREKTLAHIQAESGKHFDPQVVDAFMEQIQSE